MLHRTYVCKSERSHFGINYCEYGVAITSRFTDRQGRSPAFHFCGKYIEFGARGRRPLSYREQLGTRATLPRFPSSTSSSFTSSFFFFSSSSSSSLLLPSRGRSTNPGSSVIPRALSGLRTCLSRAAIPLFGVCSSPNSPVEEARCSSIVSL